jgi:hypothetical protein
MKKSTRNNKKLKKIERKNIPKIKKKIETTKIKRKEKQK